MSFWDDAVLKSAEENTGGFDPLPAGKYRVQLVESEVKATKAGGHYVNVKFELHGNQAFDGRVLFHKFNVDNANATAVSIGLGQLKELAEATGTPEWYEKLKSSKSWEEAKNRLNNMFEAVGNKPVEVKVIIKKDEKYGDQNDIKRFIQAANNVPAGISSIKQTPFS